ncbi:hypothetical protein PVAND_015699 [Polypedilum vanderplanki]|uniref:Secreted protein n=1 Tax=Polypedilum vanderplanki TaxID=319348 RepID=A0A9J6BDR0_POLVA|nr:hypothetical protein PVAND_015699 [Polypedilum vanderplanki]
MKLSLLLIILVTFTYFNDSSSLALSSGKISRYIHGRQGSRECYHHKKRTTTTTATTTTSRTTTVNNGANQIDPRAASPTPSARIRFGN